MSVNEERFTSFEVEKKETTPSDDGCLSKIKTMMKENPTKFYLICGGALAAVTITIVVIAVVASSGGSSDNKKEDPNTPDPPPDPPIDDGKLHYNETYIDELLLKFPKREKMTYEEYLGNLTYFRDKYKLNIENALLLSYKWVSQNIYYNGSYNDPKKVYEIGYCDCYGYAHTFIADCVALGLQNGTDVALVHGTARTSTCNENNTGANHMWNKINIRGKWYLVDQTRGYDAIKKNQTDTIFNFLIDPYIIVRDHWPDDPKDQFLDTPINITQYCNRINTAREFAYCGFYKIEPDYYNIFTTTGKANIKLYFRDPNVTLMYYFYTPSPLKDKTNEYTNLTQYSNYFQIDYTIPSDLKGNYTAYFYCMNPPRVPKKSLMQNPHYINFIEG